MQYPPLPFVVLDTETTGFVPRVHKVIEFASMRIEGGEIVDTYEQLFHADEVPPVVEALTRIRTLHIQDKPQFADKQQEILSHIGEGTLIVGQNVLFDLGMLKGEGLDLTHY
ncbi:MAG: 3'-5' exonuclease, partial [Patescibacteria group bacterium]